MPLLCLLLASASQCKTITIACKFLTSPDLFATFLTRFFPITCANFLISQGLNTMARDHNLNVRLSASEYEALTSFATQTKKTRSAWAREKLLTPCSITEFVQQTSCCREQQRQLQTIVNLVQDLIFLEELDGSHNCQKRVQILEHIQQFLDEYL